MPFRIAMRYQELYLLMERMIPYLTDHGRRLGITPTILDGLSALNRTFQKAYAVYISPETQTRMAREAVESAYKPLKARVREIQQSIKKNVAVDLTDEDRNELEIHKDKTTRTRAKVPDFAPTNDIIEMAHLRTKFAARVPVGREIDHLGMPVGAPRLVREIAITANRDTRPTDGDFYRIDTVGRSEHNVMWPEDAQGKTGWLRTRWANNRGESGPPSEITMAHVN